MDTSSLDKLRKHNHDFPLVTLDNPKGQVPAKSKTALKVREAEWQDQDEAPHTIMMSQEACRHTQCKS